MLTLLSPSHSAKILTPHFCRSSLKDLECAQPEGVFKSPAPVTCLSYSHTALQGSLLFVGTEDGSFSMLDVRDALPRAPNLRLSLHTGMISDATFLDCDTSVVTVSSDGDCKCVDTSTGKVTSVLGCQKTIGPLRHVCVSRELGGNHVVLAAGRGPAITVFDLRAPALESTSVDLAPSAGGCTFCLSCTAPAAKKARGQLPDAHASGERIGGIATVDHYLITASSVSGEVQMWDLRRCA